MPSIDELMADDEASVSTSEAISRLGLLIDTSLDRDHKEGLLRAIEKAKTIRSQLSDPVESSTLDYFEANAWAGLQNPSDALNRPRPDWENPELEHEITCLRRAALVASPGGMPNARACQVLTNLGNSLDKVGRFIEAIRYWDSALRLEPHFSMALGNRALTFLSYGQALYDKGHAALLLRRSYHDLTKVVTEPDMIQNLEPHAQPHFLAARERIAELIPDVATKDFESPSQELTLGGEEGTYRRWCLRERLFLCPLNDVFDSAIAARDVMSSPSVVVPLDQGPIYHGFFNQMKQEFVSARYMLYEGLRSTGPHFSDRDVLLHDTMDYPSYGLAIERVKAAFRVAYSLFDKMAFYLNQYMGLGIQERNVNYRTIWYQAGKLQNGLSAVFLQKLHNWPLQGLFWVAKDLYHDDPEFADALEPVARELNSIRNHLEHKYLKVHDILIEPDDEDVASRALADSLAHSVSRHDFERRTMTMIRLARASLMYLSLATHAEERVRASKRQPDSLVPPMPLDVIEDDWKR